MPTDESRDLGAIKRSVLRAWRRKHEDRERAALGRADEIETEAAGRLRTALHGGGAAQIARAIDVSAADLLAKARALESLSRDPDFSDASRQRFETQREIVSERLGRLRALKQVAPLHSAQLAARAAATGYAALYRQYLARFGATERSDDDESGEISALRAQRSADIGLGALSGGGKDRSAAAALSARIGELEERSQKYSAPPRLQAQYTAELGEFERASRFGAAGSADAPRAALLATIGKLVGGIELRHAQQAAHGNSDPASDLQYEKQLQPLLTEQARIGSEARRPSADRLPSLTVGGTSRSWRYLPSLSDEDLQRERLGSRAERRAAAGRHAPADFDGQTLFAQITIVAPPGTPTSRQIVPITLSKSAQTPTFANGSAGPGQR